MLIGLCGQKCKACGRVQYPVQRVCLACYAKDQFEDYTFSDKKAKVFTFCKDYLLAFVDPLLVKAIIDFDGGGRMWVHMADADPEEVQIGMPVEMTFRRFHEGAGFHNYWWKCRLIRGER